MPKRLFQPTHGHAVRTGRSPTYRAWESMIGRCYRASAGGYKFYGGRGIRVCERWHQFAAFLADMGERPDGMTLERKDSNADYEPSNCRWATRQEQNRNRRDTLLITIAGRTQCLLDWCAEKGVNYAAVRERIERGWEAERALTAPRMDVPWCASEDAMLRAFWPTEGSRMQARLPERTAIAISDRARVLGVRYAGPRNRRQSIEASLP